MCDRARLAAEPETLLERFGAEWLVEKARDNPGKHDLGDGRKPLEGEMWFAVDDQPVFAVTGFWQRTKKGSGFAMVTCAPNQLVAPIHLKAMITIPAEGDRDPSLTGGCQDVTALQQPFAADHKSARRPVCPTRQ